MLISGNVPDTSAAVNSVTPAQGIPDNAQLSVRANADEFGGQVGQAVEKAGAVGEQLATHYAEMATHTAVNDKFVNGYVPQVNQLESDYKKLQGTEALKQQPIYEQKLQELNAQYTSSGSLAQQQFMSEAVRQRALYTMNSISNHADQQFLQHQEIVTNQSMKEASDHAVSNWSNPSIVDSDVNRAMGVAELNARRKVGYDSDSQPIVGQIKNEAGSTVAADAINAALDNGDYHTARAYKAKYDDILSGKDKLQIEKSISSLNINDNAKSYVDNLFTGASAVTPGTMHYQEIQAKASIVDEAKKNNFDPNIAVALQATESGGGISAGSSRKDAFQTDAKLRDKGFEGDDLASSMHNGAKIWNENSMDLQKRMGMTISASQGYLAYNQGGAGAEALLKAAPTDTAVNALAKIMPYDEAKKHITDNGGTLTQSAGDFSKHIQDLFENHYDSQKMSNPSSDAIMNQSKIQLPAVQQVSNPHEYFNQIDEKLPAVQAAVAAIPDDKVREAADKQLKLKYEQAKLGDTAWKNDQAQIVQKIADNPRYTSMDQIPESIKSNLRAAGQLTAMEKVFNDKSNPRPKDNTYGDMSFLRTMDRLSSDNKDEAITDLAGLQQEYGDNSGLHSSGFTRLKNMLKNADTPEGKSSIANQSQFLSDLRQKMVAGETDMQGKAAFEKAMPVFFSQYEKLAKDGKQAEILAFDDKNDFLKGLNLPSSAQLTSKKIDNSVSWLSALFGGKAAPLPPTPLSKEAQEHLNNTTTVPRP